MRNLDRYLNYSFEILRSVLELNFRCYMRYCTRCDRKRIFIASGREARSIRCTSCRSTAISLSLLSCVKNLILDKKEAHVYELSYHGAVFNYLRENFRNFYYSEYFSTEVRGSYVGNVRNEDVQHLTFEQNKFDLVTCSEVFEHVPNYMEGFAEVRRVLKPGGRFAFTVPLFATEVTEQVCAINDDGSLKWSGEPEFHDSRVTGVKTVPVFWRHSEQQICTDLLKVGFKNVKYVNYVQFSPYVTHSVILAEC